MVSKKQSDRKAEIQNFVKVLYDFIWSQQKLHSEKTKQQVADRLGKKVRNCDVKRTPFFTKNIGNAVSVSMVLLRNHFHHMYLFTFPNTFKEDVKLMWKHWIKSRDNIFVKVIDTLAILAEAFLHCDIHNISGLELHEVDELFLELFDGHLEQEFFWKGGWTKLEKICVEWYLPLCKDLNNVTVLDVYLSQSMNISRCCVLVSILRESIVPFPVSESMLCDKCRMPYDVNNRRKVVYVRTKDEILDAHGNNSDSDAVGILSKSVICSLFGETLDKADECKSQKPIKHQNRKKLKSRTIGNALSFDLKLRYRDVIPYTQTLENSSSLTSNASVETAKTRLTAERVENSSTAEKVESLAAVEGVERVAVAEKIEISSAFEREEIPPAAEIMKSSSVAKRVESPPGFERVKSLPKAERVKNPPAAERAAEKVENPPATVRAAEKVKSLTAAEKVKSPPAAEKVKSSPASGKSESPPAAEKVKSPPAAEKVKSPPAAEKVKSPPAAEKVGSPPAAEKVGSPPTAEKVESNPSAEKVESNPSAEKVESSSSLEKIEYSSISEEMESYSAIVEVNKLSLTSMKHNVNSSLATEIVDKNSTIDGGGTKDNNLKSKVEKRYNGNVNKLKSVTAANISKIIDIHMCGNISSGNPIDTSQKNLSLKATSQFIKMLQECRENTLMEKFETDGTFFHLRSEKYSDDLKKMSAELYNNSAECLYKECSNQSESVDCYSHSEEHFSKPILESEKICRNTSSNEASSTGSTMKDELSLAFWQTSYVWMSKDLTDKKNKLNKVDDKLKIHKKPKKRGR